MTIDQAKLDEWKALAIETPIDPATLFAFREAIPALIAEVERLTRERDEAREVWSKEQELRVLTIRERDAAIAERDRLREALTWVMAAIDKARLVPKPGCGVGGQTIEANIKGSVYHGVDAWPIECARAAL